MADQNNPQDENQINPDQDGVFGQDMDQSFDPSAFGLAPGEEPPVYDHDPFEGMEPIHDFDYAASDPGSFVTDEAPIIGEADSNSPEMTDAEYTEMLYAQDNEDDLDDELDEPQLQTDQEIKDFFNFGDSQGEEQDIVPEESQEEPASDNALEEHMEEKELSEEIHEEKKKSLDEMLDNIPQFTKGEKANHGIEDEQVVEEPAVEEPAVEEPVAEKESKIPSFALSKEDLDLGSSKEPVAEEPAAEEPVAEEPVAEEPVAEEPVAEEPVAEEPVAEEPVAEEPVAEEPVAEEPVAEEPVAEEPVVVSQKASESSLENDDYVSSEIIGYQRYLLALNELNKPENKFHLDKFVEAIVDKEGLDPDLASAGDLIKVDVGMAEGNMELLNKVAPGVVMKSNNNISNNYDAWEVLEEAGYDLGKEAGVLPMGFLEDVQVMRAFDETYPDPDRPSLADRLRSAKDQVLEVAQSDNAKLGMSTVAFGLACAAGSVALPVAAGLYAARLMENPSVQNVMNSLHEKASGVLVKLGFAEEAVDGRKELLGDKMKAISDSKWGKVAKFGLAASLCGVGVYSILENTDFSISKIPEYAANIKDSASDFIANAKMPDIPSFEEVKNALGFGAEASPSGDLNDSISGTEISGPDFSSYTVVESDTSTWQVVKDHYIEQMGQNPSDKQIIAMINDLGMADPNILKTGDVLNLPSDFSKYSDVKSVTADWLTSAKDSIAAAKDASGVVMNSGLVDVGSMYDINEIAGVNVSIEDVARLNPDLDMENLLPGDSVELPNGDIYTVPSLEDAVATAVFPGGTPEFVHKGRLLELIQEKNPGMDLDEGWFGINTLFGNSNLGSDMANSGILEIPEIDMSALEPPVTGPTHISGNLGSAINFRIMEAAFPDGVPELFNSHAYIDLVKEANPELEWIGSKERYSLVIDLPEIDVSTLGEEVAANGVTSSTVSSESKGAVSRFLDRFYQRDMDSGLSS